MAENITDPGGGGDGGGGFLSCISSSSPQHPMYHLSHTAFLLALTPPPTTPHRRLHFHVAMAAGYFLLSTWSWNITCSPDLFAWTLALTLLNLIQTFSVLHRIRHVHFSQELEDLYQSLFNTIHVPRVMFKKLVEFEYAQVLTLHVGETYAMQNVTRTDKLALLVEGRVKVLEQRQLLHEIGPHEFLDSPEFECHGALELADTYQVTLVAATYCRYLVWRRRSLQYLFFKEPQLAYIMQLLISRDVTNKLYALRNQKLGLCQLVSPAALDIRLHSLSRNHSRRRCSIPASVIMGKPVPPPSIS